MIDNVASHVLGLPVWVALLVVFAVPALESSAFVGFVFPGEIALILGGVLAYEGRVSLAAVLAAGIAGAVVGDSVGYLIGRRYGRAMLEGTLGRFINHRHFDRAEHYLAERGGKAVFFGRFTAALRVLMPGLAGMARMHYPKFLAWNVAGGAAWGTLCVLLGYLGGSSWRHVEHLASRLGLGALGFVALAIGLGYLVRRTRASWARRLGTRLRASRLGTALARRFPRQLTWLGARLDPEAAQGLSLTVVLVLLVAATWTFLGLTQDVVSHDELALLDPRVHAWVLQHRSAWGDRTLELVTRLGSNLVLVPVLVATAIVLRRTRGSWRPAGEIVAVYGATLVAHVAVTAMVRRPRPPAQDWLSSASGWAYPSGHTMQATAAFGLLAVLLGASRSPRLRTVLAAAASCVVLLVGASRVYLGVHWPTDVAGGLCLSVAILCIWGLVRAVRSARETDRVRAAEITRPVVTPSTEAARR